MAPKAKQTNSPGKDVNKQSQKIDKYMASPVGSKKANKSIMEDTGPEARDYATLTAAIEKVFEAVGKCNSSIDTVKDQLGGVSTDVGIIREDLKKIKERCVEMETRISMTEDDVSTLKKSMKKLLENNEALEKNVTDLQNRSRRSNLRFIGFPEQAEKNNPVQFMEQWLKQEFGEDKLSEMFCIERAHRVPTKPPPPGSPPRALLIKLLSFKDKELILRLAREKKEITYNNVKIMIFQDYSAETQKKRKSFMGVKKRLQEKKLKYSLLFPSRLKIFHNDNSFFFNSPEEASTWMERQGI